MISNCMSNYFYNFQYMNLFRKGTDLEFVIIIAGINSVNLLYFVFCNES